MSNTSSGTAIKTEKDSPEHHKDRKIVELTIPVDNSVRHRVYTTEVTKDIMSQGLVTDHVDKSEDDMKLQVMVDQKTVRLRKLSMKDILPIYVNQILPSESHDYPVVSYERSYGPGYLYVLCESNLKGLPSEYYKVGVTNDLKKRLCDLQNGNPRPLIPLRLIKVRNMESIEIFLTTNLKPLSVGANGGKDWYKAKEVNGNNALIEIIDLVKNKVKGLEIPPDKFKDYVQYFIYFSGDH